MGFGDRLREERERVGLSQTDLAELGGVGRKSQFNYESEGRFPDLAYLAAIASRGLDVQYIVTGRREGQGIGESAVHQAVLDAVELLSLEKKVDADQLARAVTKLAVRSAPQSSDSPQDAASAPAKAPRYTVTFGQAKIGQAAAGDIVNKDGKPRGGKK